MSEPAHQNPNAGCYPHCRDTPGANELLKWMDIPPGAFPPSHALDPMNDEFIQTSVAYWHNTDGGGSTNWKWLIREMRRHRIGHPVPKARCFEWCAGPAFMGFALLANGLCETLVLADVNEVSLSAARATIERHSLQDRVSLYHAGAVGDIPASELGKWDLVIGNPPHFKLDSDGMTHGWKLVPGSKWVPTKWRESDGNGTDIGMIWFDTEWKVHKEFFRSIGRYTTGGADVLLIEAWAGSTADELKSLGANETNRLIEHDRVLFGLGDHGIWLFWLKTAADIP